MGYNTKTEQINKQRYTLVSTPNVKPTFTKIRISFGVRGESYGWGGGTTDVGKDADFMATGEHDYHGTVTWSDNNNTVTVWYTGSRHFHGEYQIFYEYPNGDTDNEEEKWDASGDAGYNNSRTIKTSESRFLRTISEWKWANI